MKKAGSNSLSAKQSAELKRLSRMSDEDIDMREAAEVRDWSGAKRGLFFRPMKKQLTLRLDADLVDWFRTHAPKGKGYQTDINRALRDYVVRRERRKAS